MKSCISLLTALFLISNVQAAQIYVHNRIVFTRGAEVWTMKPDGTEQKRVWLTPKKFQFGGFSTDGKRVIYTDRYRAYEQNLFTKQTRQVLVWNGGWGTGIGEVQYSPDSRQVLVTGYDTSANSFNSTILKSRLSMKFVKSRPAPQSIIEPKSIYFSPYFKLQWSQPMWSANGKQIVAVAGPGYSMMEGMTLAAQTDIWVMDATGKNARPLVQTDAFEESPSLSPDGRNLVFVRKFGTVLEEGSPPVIAFAPGLWLKNIADGTEKPLGLKAEMKKSNHYKQSYEGREVTAGEKPIFSPDGRHVAFQGNGIEVIDIDGNNQRKLCDGNLVQWIK